jgi:hypothetical protein
MTPASDEKYEQIIYTIVASMICLQKPAWICREWWDDPKTDLPTDTTNRCRHTHANHAHVIKVQNQDDSFQPCS